MHSRPHRSSVDRRVPRRTDRAHQRPRALRKHPTFASIEIARRALRCGPARRVRATSRGSRSRSKEPRVRLGSFSCGVLRSASAVVLRCSRREPRSRVVAGALFARDRSGKQEPLYGTNPGAGAEKSGARSRARHEENSSCTSRGTWTRVAPRSVDRPNIQVKKTLGDGSESSSVQGRVLRNAGNFILEELTLLPSLCRASVSRPSQPSSFGFDSSIRLGSAGAPWGGLDRGAAVSVCQVRSNHA
jgi:hypothetical protein